MKKITGLLLTVAMLCAMMTFAATPAFAEESTTEETPVTSSEENAETAVFISTAKELQSYINGLPSGAENKIKLPETMTVGEDEAITIKKPCSLTFESNTTFNFVDYKRAFYIESNDVKLLFPNGSTFDGGETYAGQHGRAIYIDGNNCEISGATFEKCQVSDGVRTEAYGGAIFINEDTCQINNCTFIDCSSYNQGGAIAVDSDKNTICNCTFTNCSGGSGGAIAMMQYAENNTVEKCTFKSCTGGDGGAIAMLAEDNTVKDCYFEDCRASCGGGIYIKHDDCKVMNCEFKLCKSSSGDGGALYLGVDVDDTLIQDCTFDTCTAGKSGGAIYTNNFSVRNKIINCIFKYCEAKDVDGGAISIGYDCDDVQITGSEFIWCIAHHDGGAINICQQSDDIKIKSCRFLNCSASNGRGGGIFFAFGDARCKVEDCDFSNCSADGDGDYVLGDNDTLIKNCNPKTDDEDLFDDCTFKFSATGSVLSEGNLWIIVAVAALAIAGVAALFIVKKKKKPALAVGADNTDEE